MSHRIITATVISALTAGVALVAAPTASASDKETRGACTSSSRWEAELEFEDSGIDAKFEVKAANQGTWRLVIVHDGDRVFADSKATSSNRKHGDDDDKDDDSSGSSSSDDSSSSRRARVEWRASGPNNAGVDQFVMRAVNQGTGEICRTTISL